MTVVLKNIRPGQEVVLTHPVKGRYSGYGKNINLHFTAQPGDRVKIIDGPHPMVVGRGSFFRASHPDWPEGLLITRDDFKTLPEPKKPKPAVSTKKIPERRKPVNIRKSRSAR